MKYTTFCRGMNWDCLAKKKKKKKKYVYILFCCCLYIYIYIYIYRQPSRCNNNSLLIIPVSSTCFRLLFCPSSGVCYSLWYNVPTMLLAGGRQHHGYIIPQAVTHSLVLLKMGKIIAWNMLSWLELLISRYCCIELVVNIIYINDARSSKYQIMKYICWLNI